MLMMVVMMVGGGEEEEVCMAHASLGVFFFQLALKLDCAFR